MKYSEFLELNEVLIEHNLTIDDVKENREVLNEVSLLGVLAGIVTLGGLVGFFGKSLLRAGIKKAYLMKLNGIAKKFEEKIVENSSKLGKKTVQIRQQLVQKEKQLRSQEGEEAKAELDALVNQKREYERRFIRETNEFISKISTSKSKEIYERIDEIKKLKDSQKTALKTYWEIQIPHIRLNAFNQLIKDGIITDKELIAQLNQDLKEDLKEAKEKTERFLKSAKKGESEKTEEKKPGEEKPGEEEKSGEAKPEKTGAQKVEDNIKELIAEKDKYDRKELTKRVTLLIKDIKKLGKGERAPLYAMLADEFSEREILRIRKSLEDEGEDTSETPQRILKAGDELTTD